MDKVLAIVVTFNAMAWIDKCLESLKASEGKVDILVIDNCSLDGTDEYVKDRYPEVEFIDNGENLGFGAANNTGLRLALERGYDFVYLMNQDAWVARDGISALVKSWKPEYGVLSPVQTDGKGRKMDRRFSKKCGKYLKKAPKGTEIVEVPFVMAAHWLVSRSAIETVGGFSPAFRLYGEDDNWLDRLHYHGLKCGVVPSVKGVHDRAQRKETKEGKVRLKCVGPVVKISNPSHRFLWRCLLEPLELLGIAAKNFSTIPLKAIPGFVGRYPELRRLRRQSKRRGAFLSE